MTTVTQGTKGLGVAIAEFVSREWTVSIPLNDNQKYDLIVDMGDGPKTVQVKTTWTAPKGDYVVQLKSVRHNNSKNTIRKFDGSNVDFLFILCGDGSKYFIPGAEVKVTSALTLQPKWESFKLN